MATAHTFMLHAVQRLRQTQAKVERFVRELEELKTPEECLRLEMEAIESERRLAREELHRNRHSDVGLDAAANRMMDCAARLREAQCSVPKAAERGRTYKGQVQDLLARLPFRTWTTQLPAGDSLLQLQSPLILELDPYLPPPGGDAPQPTNHIESEDGGGSRAPSPQISRLLVTLKIPKQGARKRPCPGARGSETEGDNLSGDHTDDDGECSDTGGASDPASPEPGNKRKMTDTGQASSTSQSKRARVDDTTAMPIDGGHPEPQEPYFVASDMHEVPETAGSDPEDSEVHPEGSEVHPEGSEVHPEGSELQTQSSQPPLRTIEFDEVYQNGNALYRHFIERHNDRYYILRCDEHDRHFNGRPLDGAARHIQGGGHQYQKGTHDLAVQNLGFEVLNCDADKQRENNTAFTRAFEKGYVPLGAPRPTKPPPSTTANTASRDRRDSSESVPNPTPGEIYRAFWKGAVVAVLVLPRGCFGDPSSAEVGVRDSLADTPLLKSVPKCYRVCPETKAITGWADGYEDGGPRVNMREFPVVAVHPRFPDAKWMSAGELKPLDLDNTPNLRLLDNFKDLQRFRRYRRELGIDGSRDADVQMSQSSGDMEGEGPPPLNMSAPLQTEAVGGAEAEGALPETDTSGHTASRFGTSESTADGLLQHTLGSGPFTYSLDLPRFETGYPPTTDIPVWPAGATAGLPVLPPIRDLPLCESPEQDANDRVPGVPSPPTMNPLAGVALAALGVGQGQAAAREGGDRPPGPHRQTSASMSAMGPSDALLRRLAQASSHMTAPRTSSVPCHLYGGIHGVGNKTQEPPPGASTAAEEPNGMSVHEHQNGGTGSSESPINVDGDAEEGPTGSTSSQFTLANPVSQGYGGSHPGYRQSFIQMQTSFAVFEPPRPLQYEGLPGGRVRLYDTPDTRVALPNGPGQEGRAPEADMSITDDGL